MALNYDKLSALIRLSYHKQVVDNIFNSNPLLALLGRKAKKQNGGRKVVVPLEYVDDSNAQGFYSGYDEHNTDPVDPFTAAEYEWKLAYAAVTISGEEEMKSTGPDAIADLLEGLMKNAEKRLKKLFSTKLFAAAGANASNEITSLNDIVKENRSLGGIDSTTYTWWDAIVKTNAAASIAEATTETDTDYLLDSLSQLYNDCSDSNDHPNLIISPDDPTEWYEHIVGRQARWEGKSMFADLGFTVFNYKGIQWVVDKACTASTIFMLNTKYLYFKVHPKRNFIWEDFRRPTKQDAAVGYFRWMGQFVCDQPRRQGVLTFDTI